MENKERGNVLTEVVGYSEIPCYFANSLNIIKCTLRFKLFDSRAKDNQCDDGNKKTGEMPKRKQL